MSSPTEVILDSAGGYVKGLRVEADGAVTLQVFASETDPALDSNPSWRYIGEVIVSEPGIRRITSDEMSLYRYFKITKLAGAPTTVTLYSV